MMTPTAAKRMMIIVLDGAAIIIGVLAAFLFRFEFALQAPELALLYASMPLAAVGYALAFGYFRLYSRLWRYSSFSDLLVIIEAVGLGAISTTILILFVHHGDYPRSVLLMAPAFTFLGIASVRFAIRMGKSFMAEPAPQYDRHSTLIVGAGDMGEALLRQMPQLHGSGHRVVGFVDDDPSKWNNFIHDIPILGGISSLPDILKREPIDEIIVAISTRRGDIVRGVAEAVSQASSKAEIKIAPRLDELLRNPGAKAATRAVRPADLLNRDVIKLDEPLIARFLSGKTVMVTGAGGTIGAELCRQALHYGPAKLLLFDNHATSLFYSDMALQKGSPKTVLVPILGSVLDQPLVEKVFAEHRPQIVLHAAAHKHLFQLESNVQEAVQNNFLATHRLAGMAERHGVECFLLVSTDKAVRPSSVMGTTKRAAELAVESFAGRSKTRFMAVRFGNVLGSSGSVLRIFQEQIEQGGPVTLTHPDMRRYFMTVEEASQLILQACAMAAGGEIFILKMGESVKILDMARNLILLNGLKPDQDIRISYTGMRRGEKLNEELLENPGEAVDSGHSQIMRLKNGHVDPAFVEKHAKELQAACKDGDMETLLLKLKELVPTFQPSQGE